MTFYLQSWLTSSYVDTVAQKELTSFLIEFDSKGGSENISKIIGMARKRESIILSVKLENWSKLGTPPVDKESMVTYPIPTRWSEASLSMSLPRAAPTLGSI